MPANLITLAYFSVSDMMKFPNSAGIIGAASTAKLRSCGRNLLSPRALLTSLLKVSTTAPGVFRGLPTPYQLIAS
jgi:hypothetical protein